MPEEPRWLLIFAFMGAGFFFLFKGAGWLVSGSSQIARRFGVSVLVVGLTVVAFGTSAPEIVVSSFAALEGKPDISLGNVLGSNIANVGLVLGACALVLPRVLESRQKPRELLWLFGSLGLLWWLASDFDITRVDAVILLGAFVLYNVNVLLSPRGAPVHSEAKEDKRSYMHVLLGILFVAVGAKFVVMGAESGAARLGIPASVIGLTVVAVGTSLPELAAGLGGAFKGDSDISLGNVVGSNVFNLLAVIGIVGLIQPLDPRVFEGAGAEGLHSAFAGALNRDFPVVLGFSVVAVVLPWIGGGTGGRAKGAFLLLAYVAYTGWLYASEG